jgi:hypothetical protein
VLSTQVSTAGLRLEHNTLMCSSMLQVSHGAVTAGEEQLVSCAAEQSKYFSICTVILDPCDDLPFTSASRWKCLCGGADVSTVVMPPAVAHRISAWGPAGGRRVATCLRRCPFAAQRGDGARCPSQPYGSNGKISLDPKVRFFGLDSKLFSKGQIDWK